MKFNLNECEVPCNVVLLGKVFRYGTRSLSVAQKENYLNTNGNYYLTENTLLSHEYQVN